MGIIFLEIAMQRFHRGGKEWRDYDWVKHIVHVAGPGVPHYEIKPIIGTKNTKRKNDKHNRTLQNIITTKGERLYKALNELEQKRGGIRETALFPQPYDEWRVNSINGKIFGYKSCPIGHNNMIKIFDRVLIRCCSFNNIYVIKRNGQKIKKRFYSLYGFRSGLCTAAATFGMNHDAIALLSQHANSSEVETYIRKSNIKKRTRIAKKKFRDSVLGSMYLQMIFINIYA